MKSNLCKSTLLANDATCMKFSETIEILTRLMRFLLVHAQCTGFPMYIFLLRVENCFNNRQPQRVHSSGQKKLESQGLFKYQVIKILKSNLCKSTFLVNNVTCMKFYEHNRHIDQADALSPCPSTMYGIPYVLFSASG